MSERIRFKESCPRVKTGCSGMGQAKYRARISSKGRVVIPREVRDKYGYRAGAELIITPVGRGRLLVERVPWLSELFGFLDDIEA